MPSNLIKQELLIDFMVIDGEMPGGLSCGIVEGTAQAEAVITGEAMPVL